MSMYVLKQGISQAPGIKRSIDILKNRLRRPWTLNPPTLTDVREGWRSARKSTTSMPILGTQTQTVDYLRHSGPLPTAANKDHAILQTPNPVQTSNQTTAAPFSPMICTSSYSSAPNPAKAFCSSDTAELQDWLDVDDSTSPVCFGPFSSSWASNTRQEHEFQTADPAQTSLFSSSTADDWYHHHVTNLISEEADDWSTLYSQLMANNTGEP